MRASIFSGVVFSIAIPGFVVWDIIVLDVVVLIALEAIRALGFHLEPCLRFTPFDGQIYEFFLPVKWSIVW